ncbi:MAG TPA: hypothetical protein DCL66_14465, partial [Gammaproteobacteria bacterium]|nr:hypothetical protein [Gammaproteobacteria bacterium]
DNQIDAITLTGTQYNTIKSTTAGLANNSLTLNIAGSETSDFSGVANADIGNLIVAVSIASGGVLTIDAAAITGEAVTGAGAITVKGVDGSTNLANVNPTTVTATVVSDVNLSGNNDLGNIDNLVLQSGIDVTLTIAQQNKITAATDNNTVTLSNAGTFSGSQFVEEYQLASAANNVFTTNAAGQTVTGGSEADTIIGSAGVDILRGGSGTAVDKFEFASSDASAARFVDDNFSSNISDNDHFFGHFDVVKDFVTGQDKIDLEALTFFNANYTGSEIYVDAGNVLPAMNDVVQGFALLIKGTYTETVGAGEDSFVVNLAGGLDTLIYFDTGGTNRGIILDNSILADGNVGDTINSSVDFI